MSKVWLRTISSVSINEDLGLDEAPLNPETIEYKIVVQSKFEDINGRIV